MFVHSIITLDAGKQNRQNKKKYNYNCSHDFVFNMDMVEYAQSFKRNENKEHQQQQQQNK